MLLWRFWRLPPAKKRMLLWAAWTVGWVRLVLWLFPFRNARRLIDRAIKNGAEQEPIDEQLLRRTTWAVEAVSHVLADTTCLTQAYAAKIIIARKGYRTNLKIGVAKKEPARLDAHAWLEGNGRVIIGDLGDLSDYKPFPDLEPL